MVQRGNIIRANNSHHVSEEANMHTNRRQAPSHKSFRCCVEWQFLRAVAWNAREFQAKQLFCSARSHNTALPSSVGKCVGGTHVPSKYFPTYHMPAAVSLFPSSGAFSFYALKQIPSGAFYCIASWTKCIILSLHLLNDDLNVFNLVYT